MADAFPVELNDHWRDYIAAKVASGAYRSAEELITAALCLLEEQEERVDQLTALLEQGEQSGDAGPWDVHAFLDEMHQASGDREAA